MTNDRPIGPTPLAGERRHLLPANGLKLAVREWGSPEAPPIVLLHGLRGYSGTWRGLAQTLSERYRLIAFDQRGRGDSEWDPGRNYYTDAYLADLEGVVDQLGLHQFALIGHSMGGTTSYVYADRHPDRLACLIIEDIAPGSSVRGAGAERIVREMATLPADFGSWAEARAYWRRTRPSVGAAGLEERLAESLQERDDGRIAWRYDAAGISATRVDPDRSRLVDLWPAVERLSVPTLVIRGGTSDFCPEDTVQEMCRRNALIAPVTIDGAGHYVHDDAPGLFADYVARFLERAGYRGNSNGRPS